MHPRLFIVVLWVVFVGSWTIAARWSGQTEKSLGLRAELRYRVPLLLGIALLVWPFGGHRFWHVTALEFWAVLALMLAGFAFCWWARLTLGVLWSRNVTLKVEHRVVDTGPYALVRHPIYTGMIVAFLATMLANPTFPALLGLGLISGGLWVKARMEEVWLRTALGEAYDAYRAKVPMLVPFWR